MLSWGELFWKGLHGSQRTGITRKPPNSHKARPCREWKDSQDSRAPQSLESPVAPQAVAVSQASAIATAAPPATFSASILASSFCSTVTTAYAYVLLLWGLMALPLHGFCLPASMGGLLIFSYATKWLLLPHIAVWIPEPENWLYSRGSIFHSRPGHRLLVNLGAEKTNGVCMRKSKAESNM